MLVDSHCHIDLIIENSPHEKAEEIIKRAQANHVDFILNVCVSLAHFNRGLKIAEQFSNVAASLGVHPNELEETVTLETLLKLGQHEKVIAIGETGLDYYRTIDHLDKQQDRFRLHIEAAKKLQKPLIIHTRAAKEDTIKIMKEEKARDIAGVMHCFSEDMQIAKQALDENFYISFSGVVTFKNAITIQEVAKNIPLDRLLIETDAPYLAPHPFRGKPNEPAYVKHTAEFIAALRNISYEQLAEQTTNNFFALFKGAKHPHV